MANFTRQKEIFDIAKFKKCVHIIGCGATGGWVALTLAKMGVPNFYLYDDDIVEEHNIPNQVFDRCQIGMKKVEALKQKMEDASPLEKMNIMVYDKKVAAGDVQFKRGLSGAVFCLTDTMSSRTSIFKSFIRFNNNVDYYIETRMGAQFLRLYSINPMIPEHLAFYESTLSYTDEQSIESVCGASVSLCPTANITANMAVWSLIRIEKLDDVDAKMGLHTMEVLFDIENNNIITN